MLAEDLPDAHLTEIQLAAVIMATRRLLERAEELLQEERMLAASRRRASELLELVKSTYGKTLAFLEIENLQEWQIAPSESAANCARLNERLAALRAALEAYEALRSTPALTRSAKQALDEQARQKEEEIYQLAVELRRLLFSSAEEAAEAAASTDPSATPLPTAADSMQESTEETAPPEPVPEIAEDEAFEVSAGEETETTAETAAAVGSGGGQPSPAQAVAEKPPALFVVEDRPLDTGHAPVSDTVPGVVETPATVSPAYQLLFARLLSQEHLCEAFWLAHVAGQDTLAGLPPDWLLHAVFLGDYVTGYDPEAADAWYEIAQAHPRAWEEAQQACDGKIAAHLVTAAALQPAILAPETGAISWLQEVQREAGELVPGLEAVVDLVARGRRIQPLAGSLGGRQSHAELADQVRRWLQLTQSAPLPYRPAMQLLRYLGSPSSPTGKLAQLIIANRTDQLDASRSLVTRLQDQRAVDDLIDTTLGRVTTGPRKRSLEGRLRETIRHRLQQLAAFGRAWFELTEGPEQRDQDRSGVAAVRRLLTSLQEARSHLDIATSNAEAAQDLHGTAAARLLASRVGHLADRLAGKVAPATRPDLPWLRAMQRPLLQMTPCPVEIADALPLPLPSSYREALTCFLDKPLPLAQAFERHLADGNLLAARLTLDLLEFEDREQSERLRPRLAAALSSVAEELQQAITRLEARVEQETIEHVLSEGERSRLLANLAGLRERVAGRDPDIRRDRIEAELDDVRKQLSHSRQTRIESLRERMEYARIPLGQISSGESSPPEWHARALHYLEKANRALEKSDIALADEYVTLVEEAVAEQRAPKALRSEPEEFAGYVETFAEAQVRLHKAFDETPGADIVSRLSNGHEFSGISTRHLSTTTLKELRDGLNAYLLLKKVMRQSGNGLLNSLDRLEVLLSYMGFYDPDVDRRPIKSVDSLIAFRVSMTDSGYSPLPEFGSERGGTYYVILVGGRPPIDRIGQAISTPGLSRQAPIILYFGRLTPLQRAEWAQYCRQHRLTALLVDELILFYVASERKLRLRRMVALSMAWGFANPYTPSAAGSVPPEMFKGRQEIIDQLMDPHGSGIIYGGRQLGKSAILRAVERQVRQQHSEGGGSRVCYLDIKQLGSRDAAAVREPSYVWTMLRDWLVAQQLAGSGTSDNPLTLKGRVIELFKKDKGLQIYLLLDEADNFLEADVRHGFDTLQHLKEISDATGRRFKVVLSGLHSVQRYALLPNQPLAHIGQPLVVGPLRPEAALELIRQPLFTLGFRFDGDEPLYRILCYTNYHPALIQHFCRELIESLTPRRAPERPAHVITLADIEQVYQRREVRTVIRERFEWTIALDDRYQALVYAIAHDQLGHHDGYRKEYSPGEVLALARDVWPGAFQAMGLDEVRALLDELIGLGVLVKSPAGSYRLRNGNVVRALGSSEEIQERVFQFLDRGAPLPEYDPKNTSVVLDRRTGEFSPLTLQQEAIINGQQTGVCLLIASDALGLQRVWPALTRFAGENEATRQGEGVYERVERLPASIVSFQGIAHYLSALRKDVRRGRVLVYAEGGILHAEDGLGALVARLAEWMERLVSRDRTLRLVLELDPAVLYRWHLEPESVRERAEGLATGLVVPRLVVDTALERYLRSLDVLDNVDVRGRVQQATGGWPWLLDRLLAMAVERTGGHLEGADLRQDARRLLADTEPGDGSLATAFVRALGLEFVPYAREILGSVHQLGVVPINEMSVDLVEPRPEGLGERALQAALRSFERLRVLVPVEGGVQVEPTVARVLGLRGTAPGRPGPAGVGLADPADGRQRRVAMG